MSYSFSFLKAECALRTIVGTNVRVCLLRLDPVLANRSGSSWWALELFPFLSIYFVLSNCYVVSHRMAVRSFVHLTHGRSVGCRLWPPSTVLQETSLSCSFAHVGTYVSNLLLDLESPGQRTSVAMTVMESGPRLRVR